jgi:Undecaprenyl-phosphate galactose phosphotransferase WbaP
MFCASPLVFTIHDLIHLGVPEEGSTLKRSYFKHVVLPSARRAFRILTVSEHSKRQILRWSRLPEHRVVVAGNGVDSSFSPVGPVKEFGAPYLLYVGNRKPHKNLDRLFQAFKGLGDPEVRLVLSGTEDAAIAHRLTKAGIASRILFAGNLPDREMPSLYRGATALVLPSSVEGFGLPLVEAMASGTPVIAASAASIPEVAGNAAILFDPLDTDEMRHAMKFVLGNRQVRTELRARGLKPRERLQLGPGCQDGGGRFGMCARKSVEKVVAAGSVYLKRKLFTDAGVVKFVANGSEFRNTRSKGPEMHRHLPALRPRAAEHSTRTCAAPEIGTRPIGHQMGPTTQPLYAPHRLRCGLLIALADLLGILLMWSITFAAATALSLPFALLTAAGLGKLICVLMPVYLLSELYPGVAMHPADELKRLSAGTTLALLIALGLVIQPRHLSTVGIGAITWVAALVTIPLSRMWMRRLGSAQSWWGVPTVILGAGRLGKRIANTLKKNPQLGLKPVGVLDDRTDRYQQEGWGGDIPYLGGLNATASVATAFQVRRAVIAVTGASSARLAEIVSRHTQCFPSVLLVPNVQGLGNLWVQPRRAGNMLGLEVSHLLAHRLPGMLKRFFDLILSASGILLLAPVFLILYLLIRVESRGPAFYCQQRVGKNGRPFKLWKFRSMYADCDQAFARALARNPSLADEWRRNHKLRRDPRVTGVGRFLRKLSLDELPQLWNVLIGDMSVVGPRPIVKAEIAKYRARFASYARVRPGITGLWQVSGRNDTSYGQRTRLDEYYVRNWSVWLDVYVLARTIRTVLLCEGAY